MDDAFDVVLDADEIFASRLGGMLRGLGFRREAFLPVALPRADASRLYFKLGAPIRARDVAPRADDLQGARVLRDTVREAIERGLDELRVVREGDPERHIAGGLRARLGGVRR
jgi:hypothetical protein